MLPLHQRRVLFQRKPWDSNPQTHMASTVFKTGSSSSRMTSVFKLRELESNQRPPGFSGEPGVTTNSNYPAVFIKPRQRWLNEVRVFRVLRPGIAPNLRASKARAATTRRRECPAGVEPASPGWKPGAFAARPRALVVSGRRGSRTLKARSSSSTHRFERGAIASWLALPSSCGGRNRTCVRTGNSRLPVPTRAPPHQSFSQDGWI